jgi:CheY-like chemotaxis protein
MKCKTRILIIGDDADMQIYLSTLLHTNGFDPLVARTEAQGIRTARTKKPGLIIMDMMMQNDTAFDLYRKLKDHRQLHQIPVMMMSAIDSKTFFHYQKMRQLEHGKEIPEPEAYVERPPEAEDFIRQVKQWVAVSDFNSRTGDRRHPGKTDRRMRNP